MSSSAIRIIMGIVILLHGIGHFMGVLAVLGIKISPNHSTHSWLLSGLLPKNILGLVCLLFSVAAILLFLTAGFGIFDWFDLQPYWQKLALYAAVISLAGLILFWNSFPFLFPNKIGVIIIDLLSIVSIVWMKWPQELFG